MLTRFDQVLSRAYRLSDVRVLWVNVALAAFVAVSHGGALMLAQSRGLPEVAEIRAIAVFSLPLCATVIASALVALLYGAWRRKVLAVHGVVAALSAAWLLVWAISLLMGGIPEGNFVWTVGLLSAWVTYATVLVLRFLVARTEAALASVYYVPLFAFFAALVIDVGVFARAL